MCLRLALSSLWEQLVLQNQNGKKRQCNLGGYICKFMQNLPCEKARRLFLLFGSGIDLSFIPFFLLSSFHVHISMTIVKLYFTLIDSHVLSLRH